MNQCPQCGRTIEPGWVSCPGCGLSLTPAPREAGTPAKPGPVAGITGVAPPATEAAIGPPVQPETTAPLQPFQPQAVQYPPQPQYQPQMPYPYQPQTPGYATTTTRRFFSGWRLAVFIVAGVLVLASVALVSANEVGTHQQLSRTRAALAVTKKQLSATESQLSSTQGQLSSTQAQLSTANNQISTLQGNLNTANNAVSVAASLIVLLKNCLAGVSTSYTDALNGDSAGALSAIDSVQGVCQEANAAVSALGG